MLKYSLLDIVYLFLDLKRSLSNKCIGCEKRLTVLANIPSQHAAIQLARCFNFELATNGRISSKRVKEF